jgi:hypothetical protein
MRILIDFHDDPRHSRTHRGIVTALANVGGFRNAASGPNPYSESLALSQVTGAQVSR